MRVVGLATCIAGGAAGVQGAPEVLPEVVVTASREKEEAGDVMHSVEVVEGKEFVEQGYRTVPEALEQTPGVSVQKTTHGHGSPFIRGFTGRQNLLLVDGIRMNNSTYRGGPVQYWNTLDGFAMERMELVKSQGSVLYGSDALGGTLNVLSRGSDFEAEAPGLFWGGTGFYQYRTNGESHVGRLETRFGEGGKWGGLLGVTGKDFGDIRDDAVGLMRHTGYPEQDVDFKFEMLVNPDVKVTLAHQYLNQDEVWRWHRTIFNDTSWNGTDTGNYAAEIYDQERSMSYLRFEGTNGSGAVQNWSATVSYQKSQDSTYQDRSPTDMRTGVTEVETYGLDLQLESALGGGSLVYGLDYYEDHIDTTGSRTGKDPRSQRPAADDSTYRLGGIFAQYRRPLSECFELAAGVRYTRVEVELGKLWDGDLLTDGSARDAWDSVVFNLRGLYRPSENWSIYGGASQGFRAPNVDDLSGNLTSRSGLDSMGSLDLAPEKTWTFELGTRVQNEEWELGAAVFYTLVDDLISSAPITDGSNTVVSTNADDAEITGVELDAAWHFAPQWTLSGFAAWQEGTTEKPLYLGGPEQEEWVSKLAPLRGSVALRYDSPDERWWVEGRVIAAEKADRLSEGDKEDKTRIPPGGTPGYLVASLRGGFQATEDVSLTLGLENLNDEDYRIHGSGVNESGFGAVIGAKVEF